MAEGDEVVSGRSFYGVFPAEDNRIYLPYKLSRKEGDSKLADHSNIAVVDYPSLKLQSKIKDNRTGAIGSWFGMNGTQQVKNGKVYA